MTRPTRTIPLADSPLVDFFLDSPAVNAIDKVFVMHRDAAQDFWDSKVNEVARTYFHLPDSSWIVAGPTEQLGSWLKAYNDEEYSRVRALLLRSQFQSHIAPVAFCVNARTCLVAPWGIFCEAWFAFIAVSDDCPIVMPVSAAAPQHCIIFTPRGAVWRVARE